MKKKRLLSLRASLKIDKDLIDDIMKKEEVWMPVVGYENFYEISSKGRLKKFDRTITYDTVMRGKPVTVTRTVKGSINDFSNNTNSKYKGTSMTDANGVTKFRYIHHLIIEAFFGVKLDYYTMADHIDNDRHNNTVYNLQVVSARYNVAKDIDKTKTTSKYVGVYWCKKLKKFVANIYINGKNKYLGCSDDELECANMYNQAVLGLV